MKKTILLLALFSFSLVACKKDYRCDCDYKEAHGDHYDDEKKQLPIEKSSKSDAEDACDAFKKTIEADPDHKDVKCELK
jgi:hypothetical protein